jgi:hypothetical protein
MPKKIKRLRGRSVASTLAVGLALFGTVWIAPVHGALVVSDVNMFRDFRGPNDVGIGAGDRVQYGANIAGGAAGAFVSATYPPTGFTDPPAPCSPLLVNPNFCSNSFAFNASRIAVPWSLTFTKPGETPLTVTGPSMVGSEFRVPIPAGVTITGAASTTPTINWSLPAGYTPDGFRVQIFDRSRLRENGAADIIHNDNLAATAASYTLPARLETGVPLVLGGNYAINFQIIETRGDVPFTGANRQILTRSSSFFAFSPLPAGAPPDVFLPTIEIVGGVPVHRFNDIPVEAGKLIFIDPLAAIGFDYQRDPGSPNFASVLLPAGFGDDLFDLWLWNGLDWFDTGTDIAAGSQFFFGPLGVDRFRILGIEVSELVDPFSAAAFITGVSFVSDGVFSGSMTPLVVDVAATVPEPATAVLVVLGFALLGWRARRLS